MLRCLLGHRYRFVADGARLQWFCARCGAPGGERHYETAERAARYARALERDAGGRRALPFALAPLRLASRFRRQGAPKLDSRRRTPAP